MVMMVVVVAALLLLLLLLLFCLYPFVAVSMMITVALMPQPLPPLLLVYVQ
jgi:hypothetical protein